MISTWLHKRPTLTTYSAAASKWLLWTVGNHTLQTQDSWDLKYSYRSLRTRITYNSACNSGHGLKCPDHLSVLRHFDTGYKVSYAWFLGRSILDLNCPVTELSSFSRSTWTMWLLQCLCIFLVSVVQMMMCFIVLEFRRRGVSQRLMSPLGISSASRTSPGLAYNRLSLGESPVSPSFTTAGELMHACH